MRILHVGLCVDGKNEGLPYALREASTLYHEISTGDSDLNDKINKAIFDWNFDIAFFQIQSPGIVQPFIFQKIKGADIFTINWSGDMRSITAEWYYKTNADLTLFTNTKDVEALRKVGLKSDFLQIGIDPKVFKIHGQKRNEKEVLFLGNNYGSQFPLGGERTALSNNLISWGYSTIGSYRGAIMNLTGNQLEESIVYNNCKIGINHSHFNEYRYTSDRMFRILASGCFCLSHHYSGIEIDFEIGKHLDVYHNFNDLKKKINYYLENDEARIRIAKNGFDLCHSTYTYKQMVNNLLNLVDKYK
ncbi:MAG: glycosyltransferase family 1 protein [Bacteroidetes bacterium]|nr:glycosyltransferase family 1 protein [Bacteroidota bacterium]